ncbi:hypothetical protein WJX84_009222 [Apatococcus fuscideae]|uniref:Rieske domain-containing protein n=1 Tax=Apatococcus fuscideae TaxID=2026836 RepID=A0AAW1SUK8_9CHLO
MSFAPLPVATIQSRALAEGGRQNVEIQGRKVTLARLGGRVYCFDSTCYHMGGPLSQGDIEDVNGTACVTCPWHFHKISLETGGTIEKGLLNTTCESAPKQRLHTASDGSDGMVHVTINDLRSLASDKLEEDEPMSLSQTDSETSEYTSAPSPLMPYAGFNRSAFSPSPVKAPEPQTERLKFARRKAIPFGRHAEARAAILGKAKPPPMMSTMQSQKHHSTGPTQPTLQDLWKQQSAPQGITTADDMEY